ncbi:MULTISPECIES: helix-turn-helix domain-containing protein [Nocardiaceae]|uniref:DNA-binding IclR family transcriptional regulator n=1 Tax=Rhodococcoides corynebacterioides TaxID=53972 RepID=A0ABS2KV56_9NOCA|nr:MULTISPECIES: helix-turn-helix domain-containing protein [Rhodococcus]MBM7415782.1 DNA-binding IclR family transcriptional regulator [Rhodococcus corynebacterioides]MBP1118244.1 DNA-binding IclR family transcriptional regulator [Rhodococcus sp. PvP016]
MTRHQDAREHTTFGGQQPKAVQKALSMLEAVAHLGPGATAKQIAAHTRVPPATAYRILNVLVADGFLVRVPDLSGFALGRRTSELAYAASSSTPPRSVKDVLDGMRAETRHGLYAASFRDGSLRMADTDPDHESVPATTIARNPHAHAIGKLMLAYHPRPIVSLTSITAHTIVDADELRTELTTVLATELSFEDDESRIGRAALAVPVRAEQGSEVVGGLCLQGGSGRFSRESTTLVDFLRAGARELRGLL